PRPSAGELPAGDLQPRRALPPVPGGRRARQPQHPRGDLRFAAHLQGFVSLKKAEPQRRRGTEVGANAPSMAMEAGQSFLAAARPAFFLCVSVPLWFLPLFLFVTRFRPVVGMSYPCPTNKQSTGSGAWRAEPNNTRLNLSSRRSGWRASVWAHAP